ncbi:MAG: hypothetical protein MZV70_63375 [Desulfobacterales bacterium]|nr:hypothetical protein [Desulfobacterales bacterium]
MKEPVKPKPLPELFGKYSKELPRILQAGITPAPKGQYLHWDKLRQASRPRPGSGTRSGGSASSSPGHSCTASCRSGTRPAGHSGSRAPTSCRNCCTRSTGGRVCVSSCPRR